MSAFITCHITGRTFDYDSVLKTPFKLVPGTNIPLDQEAVDFYCPAPSAADPRAAEKSVAREQATADAATYKAAADAARG